MVLLKGPTTVVAEPSGQAIVVTTGDQRLATAGSGDVLAGIIGAFLARGAKPFDYYINVEILNELTPSTWTKKEI